MDYVFDMMCKGGDMYYMFWFFDVMEMFVKEGILV